MNMNAEKVELLTTTTNIEEEVQCPICYDESGSDSYVTLKCSHKFCLACFMKNINYINVKCPLCRDLIIEAEPILETYNHLLQQTNNLTMYNNHLLAIDNEKTEEIEELKEKLENKEKKIDEYRTLLIQSTSDSSKLLDKLLKMLPDN